MFAHHLYLDTPEGHPDVTGEPLRDLQQVWDALGRLDGRIITMLIVAESPPGPNWDAPFFGKGMCIGGGLNDQYICEGFVDPEERDLATMLGDPSIPRSEEVVEVTRGQPEVYPRHLVVGRALVESALRAFVETGDLDPKLRWFRTDQDYW